MDVLQIIANIAQIFSVLWTITFGSYAIHEVLAKRSQSLSLPIPKINLRIFSVITIIILLFAILVRVIPWNNQINQIDPLSPTPTPTVPSYLPTPTPSPTPVPIPSPTPVPTPTTIQQNTQLDLVSTNPTGCTYIIQLTTIEINMVQNRTSFHVSVTNQNPYTTSAGFSAFNLRASNGQVFLSSDSRGIMQFPTHSTSLAPQKPFTTTRVFSFIPRSGEEYLLETEFEDSSDSCKNIPFSLTF